jgi:transposase
VKTLGCCYDSPVILLGESMGRFVKEADRGQRTLLPECLDDFIDESNPVRVIDVFVDALDLAEMGFEGVDPAATGRPSYHPSVLLKLYTYGYLNRVQSSRRLEREAGRNVELMWLLGRLAPDHKTIGDFRKDNGVALRKVCARFVELCREMRLLATASVAMSVCAFAVSPAPATSFISPPLCRTSRHWRCVYSARQQEEPVRRLPKKLAGLGVVLADLAPTSS